jgi:hypothetical protein
MGAHDCFPAAMTCVATLEHEGTEVLLAHGIPLGRGGDALGIRYWHAWAEVKPAGQPWHVIDLSNGARAGMPRAAYYRLGRIDPTAVHRYTPAEMHEQIALHGTYGPWAEGWETATDEPTVTYTPVDA